MLTQLLAYLVKIIKLQQQFILILMTQLANIYLHSKNAVRANLLAHGVSPISAFSCNPKFSPKTSKSLQIPVYDVPNKFAYKDSSTGVHTSTFAIRTYLGIFFMLPLRLISTLGRRGSDETEPIFE